MSPITVVDRKATSNEVSAHRAAIHDLASRAGLSHVRLRSDGTLVVHNPDAGYRAVLRLSAAASALLGTYVHVITDEVGGATSSKEL